MSRKSVKRKERPSYPGVARQLQGLLLIVFAVVCIEFLSVNFGRVRNPGSYLLLVVMFVSYWSGLRMGIIASFLTLAYLLYAYSEQGGYFLYTPRNTSRLISATILIPGLALLVGTIQGRMRSAAIREWDARTAAEAESLQRKQAEDALQAREDLWELVVQSAMDAVIAMKDDGTITLWNKNAEAVFGWKDDEVIGRPLADTIVPSIHREAHKSGLKRFVETGEENILGKRLELIALAKDGREFPVELSVVKHQTSDGFIFIGFVRDMTEQKKLNERLRQAQKMEAIGTLAGGIAHDFNNILAAISGNLMFVRSDIPEKHPTQESLLEIEKAVARATHVVRQILTFSSVREINPEPIDVRETLQEAIKLLQAAIPASMEIEAYFEADLPAILADANDIHQIVLNLGINAFHAMKGKSGRFEVQVTRITLDETTAESLLSVTPGNYLRISVGDTGCGMDATTLQRVFEPFFTTKAQGEGTGLGLAVVYGIVERHQGAITVYSQPDKGTVFHIYFPVADTAAEKTEQKIPAPISGNGERILYVDDDEALVFMMTRMLNRLNYQVAGFQHPREALAAFRANPDGFDLVITDMSMPHMDGPALVQELQAIRPNLPVVMVTGYIRPNDLEQATHLGINQLILKPNTVHEMSDALHRILSELRREEVGTP